MKSFRSSFLYGGGLLARRGGSAVGESCEAISEDDTVDVVEGSFDWSLPELEPLAASVPC